jgi:eukaryotic-like serine/threonine-protein kinase
MTTNDRDAMLKLALSPSPDLRAPADLGDAIYTEVLATSQRRSVPLLGRLARLPAPALVSIALLALLALVLVIAALSRPPRPAVLTMYHGGPDRTGVMPGPAPQGEPIVLWTAPRPGAVAFSSMPLPFEDEVIVADQSGMLVALEAATGHERWHLDAGSLMSGAPTLVQPPGSEPLILVGTAAGDVVAATAAGGREVWRRPVGGAVSNSVLELAGVAYAATDTGDVIALDPATGTIPWTINLGAGITRNASADAGVLYVGTTTGRFSAIDLASHTVRWEVALADGQPGTPTLANGRVYVAEGIEGLADHDLLSLDPRDGSPQWRFASPAGAQVHMGGIAGGQVYAMSEDHNVYALDANTGTPRWTATTDGRVTTLAAIVGDTVIFSSEDSTVRALDAKTGRELWRQATVGHPTMPAVVDGRVYVGTDLGQVIALGGSGAPSP